MMTKAKQMLIIRNLLVCSQPDLPAAEKQFFNRRKKPLPGSFCLLSVEAIAVFPEYYSSIFTRVTQSVPIVAFAA
jgi:hypothetical protein